MHEPGLVRNQSLQRAVGILRALADRQAGASASDVARDTALPLPTARRLIATLADARLVDRLPDGRWVLGRELVRLGRSADPYVAVVAVARPHLARLADAAGETVMLGAASLPHLDVICQVDAPSIVGAGNWIGRSFGIHASAGGKLALAARSDAQAREMLGAGPLERYTARTIVTTDAFLSELARVRDTSVAESVDELEHGLVTVAVPVGPLDAHEFAVGVCGPTFRLGSEHRAALVPPLRSCAEAIARDLG